MTQEVGVDEAEERAQGAFLQFLALLAAGCGPILPAVRMFQRGPERHAQRLGLVLLAFLAFVENTEKQNPGEFGNILQRPGTVAAPHDVAD